MSIRLTYAFPLFVCIFFCSVSASAGDSPTSYMVNENLRLLFPGTPVKFKGNGGYGYRYKDAVIEYTVDVMDSVKLDFSDEKEMDSILKLAMARYANDPGLKDFQKTMSDTVIGGAKGKMIELVKSSGAGYCRMIFFATIYGHNLYYLSTAQNDCSASANTLANYYFEDAVFEQPSSDAPAPKEYNWIIAVLNILKPLFVIAIVWTIIYLLIRSGRRKQTPM